MKLDINSHLKVAVILLSYGLVAVEHGKGNNFVIQSECDIYDYFKYFFQFLEFFLNDFTLINDSKEACDLF